MSASFLHASFLHIWGAPIAIALLTLAGLIGALLGEGVWDTLSAVALAAPVLAAIRYAMTTDK